MNRAALLVIAGALAGTAATERALGALHAKPIGTGVVVIDTSLGYQQAQAAGTGMVLTSSGEILTNNHVIRGATSIIATVPGTGRRYATRVVGYDVAKDVAVLQLAHASNLKTVSTRTTRAVVGERVRAVGNAGGTGSLTAAVGRIVAVGRSITASDDDGASELLHGLIETNADVQAGDSGGPLFDHNGEVLGMDTAASRASSGFSYTTSAPDAYAIPISNALAIAHKIVTGQSSAEIHVGATAFLGVELESTGSGAVVAATVQGGPADSAGIVAGDTIVQIGPHRVQSPSDLSSYLQTRKPGAVVAVTLIDQMGSTSTVNVTLGSGPPK